LAIFDISKKDYIIGHACYTLFLFEIFYDNLKILPGSSPLLLVGISFYKEKRKIDKIEQDENGFGSSFVYSKLSQHDGLIQNSSAYGHSLSTHRLKILSAFLLA